MFSLSINKPCHEKWEDMSPVERGAYCASCYKNVVDFTGMEDAEIIDHFEKNEQVCGRFRIDQLNRPLVEISPAIFSLNIPFWKKFLAALFICFSAFITGCSTHGKKDYTKIELPSTSPPINAKEKLIEKDSVQNDIIATDDEPASDGKSMVVTSIKSSPDKFNTVFGFTITTPSPSPHSPIDSIFSNFTKNR